MAWRADEREKMEPLVRARSSSRPQVATTIKMLMPTAQWPFDRALLVAEVGGSGLKHSLFDMLLAAVRSSPP